MAEIPLTIFNFDSYIDYLGYLHKLEKDKKEGSTLSNWAKRLGFNSPSSLSMVLKGKRLPSDDFVAAIINDLALNPKESAYLRLLIRLEKLKIKNQDTSIVLRELSKFDENNKHALSLSEFEYIADWHYLVLKQLVRTKEFKEDYGWIHKKLHKKVSIANIKNSIQRLIDLGILARGKNNKLYVKRDSLESTNDIPSQAIKEHHKQMMLRATEALYAQDVSKRQMNSMTLRVDSSRIDAAKEKILQFIYAFNEEFALEELGGDTYQLNVQFFGHTDSEDL